jgi:Zn-dependent peptidase ImmA (M78 family)/transcriptional regulator with XRE-family HTH domain
MPKVNPEIMIWARDTAGLSLEEAAGRLAIGATRKLASPAERLASIEDGTEQPSRNLLLKMARVYRRPLLAFYLEAPPKLVRRGSDFRVLPDEPDRRDEAIIDAILRDIRARQSVVHTILEDEEDAGALPFVGSKRVEDGVDVLVRSIQDQLKITHQQLFEARNPEDAFALLRDSAERAGVFVLLVGDLGSHHTTLDVEVFRGFALADPIAPFAVINHNDARAAWSFTLMHELVHIWLGQTGVSGGVPDRDIEKFCNDVASEFLLPREELRRFMWPPQAVGLEQLQQAVNVFADSRNISRSMVAYTLFRAGLIDRGSWVGLRDLFRKSWALDQEHRRERQREQEGGPSYYVIRRHRLGHALLRTTARMLASGALSTSKAGRVLGVKPRQVGELISGSLG